MTIANYFRAPQFEVKKPVPDSANECLRHGDNIYEPLIPLASAARDFRQLYNQNHWDGEERACGNCRPGPTREHDLSGRFVLICETLAYFGAKALVIPKRLRPEVPKGQSAHGSQTKDEARARAFIEFVLDKAGGRKMVCHPWTWPTADDCWKAKKPASAARRSPRPLSGQKHKRSC
jgi:hypothetical protein